MLSEQRGGWCRSFVTGDLVYKYHRGKFLPSSRLVKHRLAPEGEREPKPRVGERVVFLAHFARGFGLPVSPFLLHLFDFFDLQLHHLSANAIAQLSYHAACCESYLGVWPEVANFLKFFHFKAQNTIKDDPQMETGCCAIYPRLDILDTVKFWQRSYFYVSNATDVDWIGLPPFVNVPSSQKAWTVKGMGSQADINRMAARVEAMEATERLTARDIALSWMAHRVLDGFRGIVNQNFLRMRTGKAKI